MTIFFPSDHTIKHVLAGDDEALLNLLRGKDYQELNFAHKNIEGKAAVKIIKTLKSIRIASINFTANFLNTPYLAEFMKYMAQIKTERLSLAHNGICPQGAVDIIENLGPTSIKNLNLAYNDLGPDASNALYQACMAKNIQVDLAHNHNWRYRFS